MAYLSSTIKNSSTLKLVTILFITLAMTIPVSMVEGLIHERLNLKHQAETNISSRWGGKQVLSAPLLAIPYREKIVEDIIVNNGWHTNDPVPNKKIHYVDHTAYLLADNVSMTSDMTTETRYFGIYDMPVYITKTTISGDFSKGDLENLNTQYSNIQWSQARLLLPVEDARGIRSISALSFDDKTLDFVPPNGNSGVFEGIEAELKLDPAFVDDLNFSFDISLAGSRQLDFLPLARSSNIVLNADWTNPSFSGSYLPIERKISEAGFNAQWNVLSLNRSFGQTWSDRAVDADQITRSSFGIALFQPADVYQQNTRSMKYAVLFIAITFMAFFLFEIFFGLHLHPVQYFFTGGALSTFYLLLLAMSEHLYFSVAYLISSIAITLLMSGYSVAILKQRSRGLIIGLVTAVIYGFLYFLIQSEQNSLLFGSLGFFTVLATIMYLTRNIDWYNIKSISTAGEKSEQPTG